MTASSRLLTGFGVGAVAVLGWVRLGRRGVRLEPPQRLELALLALGALWGLGVAVRGSLSFLDAAVLLALFAAYIWRVARGDPAVEMVVGPAATLARLPRPARRAAMAGLFCYPAAVIILAADPFAGSLVATGERLGIGGFRLIGLVAPLVSEAPEVSIAVVFVLRRRPDAGIGTILAATVNQWLLIVGSLPLAYAVAGAAARPVALASHQTLEVTLSAAQSLFVAAALAPLALGVAAGGILLALWAVPLGVASPAGRAGIAAAFGALFVFAAARPPGRRGIASAVRDLRRGPGRVAGPADGG